jgi:phenylalanine-4-hydroxylase
LHTLYAEIRTIRDNDQNLNRLDEIFEIVKNDFKDQWLIVLEILEIAIYNKFNKDLISKYYQFLIHLKNQQIELKNLIEDGLSLLKIEYKNID